MKPFAGGAVAQVHRAVLSQEADLYGRKPDEVRALSAELEKLEEVHAEASCKSEVWAGVFVH